MAKINYIVNPVEGGWSPWDTRIGGSEECVVETSRRLYEKGHDVTVFHNGRHGEFRGVSYLERQAYLEMAGDGVTVNLNYADLPPQEPTVYWTSLYPEARRDLSAFKEVLALSQWQVENSGIDHPRVSVVPPGFDSEHIVPGEKIPGTVLYASSPDRGLDNLLKIWPEVVSVSPSAQLIITYGVDDVGSTPNCACLGAVSIQEMNELYATSDIWCHPCSGGELYCMTGIKAQAAGCYPVYYPTMALEETVRLGTRTSPENLAQDLIAALAGKRPNAEGSFFLPDWTYTTDKLEKILLHYA